MNVALLWPDYVQRSISYLPTFSNGSWSSAFPLANLQSMLLASVARSTDAQPASTKLDIDLKITRTVGMLAIGRHNATSAGTITVKLSTVADFSSTVHVSSALALWPAGKTVEDLDGYNIGWSYVLNTPVAARYVRLEISDASNPAGFIELARLPVGGLFQPAVNFLYGTTAIGWETDTRSDRTPGDVDHYDVRKSRRSTRFQLSQLSDAEAFDIVFEMQRRLGLHGQTYIVSDPALTGFRRHQQSFLCTMRKLSAIEYPYGTVNSAGFEFQEVL